MIYKSELGVFWMNSGLLLGITGVNWCVAHCFKSYLLSSYVSDMQFGLLVKQCSSLLRLLPYHTKLFNKKYFFLSDGLYR